MDFKFKKNKNENNGRQEILQEFIILHINNVVSRQNNKKTRDIK